MRIQRLDLHTHDLNALQDFYRHLGFACLVHENQLSIACGETELHFHPSGDRPYYHYAFNIPANRLQACHDWLASKVELLPFEGSTIIDFPNWKAKAIYAHDPAQNIIEFIAREDVGSGTETGDFTIHEVLNICEIGCPVQRIADFRQSIEKAQVPIYSGDDDRFCAIGDIHGLFIVVDPGKEFWLPTELKTLPFPFRARIVEGDRIFHMAFDKAMTVHALD